MPASASLRRSRRARNASLPRSRRPPGASLRRSRRALSARHETPVPGSISVVPWFRDGASAPPQPAAHGQTHLLNQRRTGSSRRTRRALNASLWRSRRARSARHETPAPGSNPVVPWFRDGASAPPQPAAHGQTWLLNQRPTARRGSSTSGTRPDAAPQPAAQGLVRGARMPPGASVRRSRRALSARHETPVARVVRLDAGGWRTRSGSTSTAGRRRAPRPTSTVWPGSIPEGASRTRTPRRPGRPHRTTPSEPADVDACTPRPRRSRAATPDVRGRPCCRRTTCRPRTRGCRPRPCRHRDGWARAAPLPRRRLWRALVS
jgi:hypothetical protein